VEWEGSGKKCILRFEIICMVIKRIKSSGTWGPGGREKMKGGNLETFKINFNKKRWMPGKGENDKKTAPLGRQTHNIFLRVERGRGENLRGAGKKNGGRIPGASLLQGLRERSPSSEIRN